MVMVKPHESAASAVKTVCSLWGDSTPNRHSRLRIMSNLSSALSRMVLALWTVSRPTPAAFATSANVFVGLLSDFGRRSVRLPLAALRPLREHGTTRTAGTAGRCLGCQGAASRTMAVHEDHPDSQRFDARRNRERDPSTAPRPTPPRRSGRLLPREMPIGRRYTRRRAVRASPANQHGRSARPLRFPQSLRQPLFARPANVYVHWIIKVK